MRKALVVVVAVGALCVTTAAKAEMRGYKIVVNKANPVSSLKKAEVAKIFMKQSVKWASGLDIEPVDQNPSASVRERFTEDVHGKPVAAVQVTWQRIVFSGRGEPPPELSSDGKVLYFVSEHHGGIGYVNEGAPTEGVKVVDVTP